MMKSFSLFSKHAAYEIKIEELNEAHEKREIELALHIGFGRMQWRWNVNEP